VSNPLTAEQVLRHLRRANTIARDAMSAGHHPFGALPVAPDGGHAEHPTLDLPCREVFWRGQKAIDVLGPVPEVQAEDAALHRGFWAQR
jgi:hypothetical protein